MANYFPSPPRPRRTGRIDGQVYPSPTYQGGPLAPDYSPWMHGLADFYAMQDRRRAGIPVGTTVMEPHGVAGEPKPDTTGPAPSGGMMPRSQVSTGADQIGSGLAGKGGTTGQMPFAGAIVGAGAALLPEATAGIGIDGAGATVGGRVRATASSPHLIDGIPAQRWFQEEAQLQGQDNAFATYHPEPAPAPGGAFDGASAKDLLASNSPATSAATGISSRPGGADTMSAAPSHLSPSSVTQPKPQDDDPFVPLASRPLRGRRAYPGEDLSDPFRPRWMLMKGKFRANANATAGPTVPGNDPFRPAPMPKGWRAQAGATLQAGALSSDVEDADSPSTADPAPQTKTPFPPSPQMSAFTSPKAIFGTDPYSYLQPSEAGFSGTNVNGADAAQQTPNFPNITPRIDQGVPGWKNQIDSNSGTSADSSAPVQKTLPTKSANLPIQPAEAHHEVEPSDADREVFNSIYDSSPTARMLYNHARERGFSLQFMEPGGVAKFTREPDATATAISTPPLKQIYVDSLGNEPKAGWAQYTAPYHEVVHLIQQALRADPASVPAPIRQLMESVTYPDPSGNYADFQARRVQNIISNEYNQARYGLPTRTPLKEFGGEYMPENTYFGRGFTPPSDVPKLEPPVKRQPSVPKPPTNPQK